MAQRKSNQIYVRVTDEFKNRVDHAARTVKLQKAAFVVDALERRLKELARKFPELNGDGFGNGVSK